MSAILRQADQYPTPVYEIAYRKGGEPHGKRIFRKYALDAVPDRVRIRGALYVRENMIRAPKSRSFQLMPVGDFKFESRTLPPNWKYAREAGCTFGKGGRVQFESQNQLKEAMRRAKHAGEPVIYNDGLDEPTSEQVED